MSKIINEGVPTGVGVEFVTGVGKKSRGREGRNWCMGQWVG